MLVLIIQTQFFLFAIGILLSQTQVSDRKISSLAEPFVNMYFYKQVDPVRLTFSEAPEKDCEEQLHQRTFLKYKL